MNVPTVGQTRLDILGATGMVGGYALRYALDQPAVGSVTAISRRTLGISHPKLREVLNQEFGYCSAVAPALSDQDAAIFCLGAYTGAVSDAQLRAVTVGYVIAFARVLRASSPDAAFSFLSGSGADPTGKSRLAFARYKGEAENALLAFISLDPRISTPSSRERSRISAISFCDGFTRCFELCFPVW